MTFSTYDSSRTAGNYLQNSFVQVQTKNLLHFFATANIFQGSVFAIPGDWNSPFLVPKYSAYNWIE